MERESLIERPRDELAPVTRRERADHRPWMLARGLVTGALYLLGRWGLRMDPTLPNGLVWYTAAAGIVGLTVLLHLDWRRRRIGLRVDEIGVHELLADGSQRTLAWKTIVEIRRPMATSRGGWVLIAQGQKPLEFDSRIEDAHALASLIHARLHHLPLLPPHALPEPDEAEIEHFFGQLPPVRLWNVPFLLRWGTVGVLTMLIWAAAVVGLISLRLWFELLMSLGVPVLLGCWLRLIPLRVEVAASGIALHYYGDARVQLPWKEIIGRDGTTIRGLYRDLALQGGPWGTEKILDFIDRLIARRDERGGVQLQEKPSEATLTMVEPGSVAAPSAATLVEVSESKARMTGREIEAVDASSLTIPRQEPET